MSSEEGTGMSALDRQRRDLEVMQGLYARWERGDFGYDEPFADDIVWVPSGLLDSGEFRGAEAMREQWQGYLQAWREFRIKAVEVIPGADGKYVVVQVFRGTGKASGATTEGRTALVITMRDGKIARMEGFWEREEALRAAGIEA